MFDWADYLVLARELVQRGEPSGASEQSRLRCAVSRAYYAAFGRARGYLSLRLGEAKIPDGPEVHEFVVTWLQQDSDRRCRKVGEDLDSLRQYRNDADYHAEVAGWGSKAHASLRWASRSVDQLEKLP
jgi:uncharacterized protein (UPF0332 family)